MAPPPPHFHHDVSPMMHLSLRHGQGPGLPPDLSTYEGEVARIYFIWL